MKDREFNNNGYTLIFSNVSTKNSCVRLFDQGASQSCKSRDETTFKALDPRRFDDYAFVLIAKLGCTLFDHQRVKEFEVGISVFDQGFNDRIQQYFPSIIGDLIDLAVAIHATDRLAFQGLRKDQTFIRVVLPVRHPEILNSTDFQEKLEDLLEWTTGSKWSFEFCRRSDGGRDSEQQPWLLSFEPYVDEVTLWSGGLDALAGLYNRLQAHNEKSFMLFGTGSNENVYARQEHVFKELKSIFPNRLSLCRVPIRFNDSKQYQKNKISRARGVVFTFLGAACAYLMGRKVLYLYENGIGAINLPYCKSAIGLDHSRSVHPLTLLKVSDTISTLLGENFQVKNPFLFSTKAQMCKLLAKDERCDLLSATMSCDSPHRKQLIQCGYCSSCILRKQAVMATSINDMTGYVVPNGKTPKGDIRIYFRHMLSQVSTLRDLLSTSAEPDVQWSLLTRRFPMLDDIVDRTSETENLQPNDMQQRLLKLYQSYVSEWDAVEVQLSEDFFSLQNSDQQTSDESLAVAQ